jgi:hypothetical protein
LTKQLVCPWEAIIIDNTNPSRAIAEVYNEGAGMAQFPIVCFAHEDITFETTWLGRKAAKSF